MLWAITTCLQRLARHALRSRGRFHVQFGTVASVWLVSILMATGCGIYSRVLAEGPSTSLAPIDLSEFRSGIQHWRRIRDESRFITPLPDQPSYAEQQVAEILANILLFQRSNGGWPKDYDMTAILTDQQRQAVRATRDKQDTSFDNGNIHSQVHYLARAYTQMPDPLWREACERGLDFILQAQYDNGGFPQRFPHPQNYQAHITFNDGVMIGNLQVLQLAAQGDAPFAWLDDHRRRSAADAVRRGIECILKCQVRVDGTLTGWCQQHDRYSYEAQPARTFELASLCPQDTTQIARFLMQQAEPSDAMVAAVDAAVHWLQLVKIEGIEVAKVPTETVSFERHDADFDLVVLANPDAKPIWARHYEIGTNRPIFAGRDAIKRYALAEIERERRTGSAWYGRWPAELLKTEYKAWRQQWPSH
ncbi:MAG: pectate lyase [Pirellulaceae bacterium]|nr:pectate lyase [Pirellulaceae bacterium]